MAEKIECARCTMRVCGSSKTGDQGPSNCPTKTKREVIEQVLTEYDKPEVSEFARQSSIQEFECYMQLPEGTTTRNPRVEEVIQFAKKMDYKKLGIVFCLGLANEAATLTTIFEKKGFEVTSACCKVGGVPKEEIGIKPEEKIAAPDQYESMCNPIAQAEIMNAEKPDLVVMVGLCIGHDTLFLQYCNRPVTVLAVKDRVLAHNPLGALYLSPSVYYGRLLEE